MYEEKNNQREKKLRKLQNESLSEENRSSRKSPKF